jgi:hypothetical protein
MKTKAKKKISTAKILVYLMLTILIFWGVLFLFKGQIRSFENGDEQPNYWPSDIPNHPWYQNDQ